MKKAKARTATLQAAEPTRILPSYIEASGFYSRQDLLAILRISEEGWSSMLADGLETSQIGNQIYVLGSDLIQMIHEKRKKTKEQRVRERLAASRKRGPGREQDVPPTPVD